jgi:DNA-binding response OmpR family regulator
MSSPILIVSNTPTDVELLRFFLQLNKVANAVTVLEDGSKALWYLSGASHFADRKLYPLPGVLMMDLHLTAPGAFEILEWRQSQAGLQEMLCVLLVQQDELSEIRRAHELGAKWFMVKPLRPGEMAELIRAFPAYWARATDSGPV